MVIYLGSLVQLCCGEGGTLQANITGVCGECSQCLGHTGLAHSVCVFPSILLRLQVALQGNCLKRALGCVHFPDLSRSGAGSRVCDPLAPLSMGIPQARILEWIAIPSSRGSSQSRDQTQVSQIAGRFSTV